MAGCSPSNGQVGFARLHASISKLRAEVDRSAVLRTQPGLNTHTDVNQITEFSPCRQHTEPAKTQSSQITTWAGALQTIR